MNKYGNPIFEAIYALSVSRKCKCITTLSLEIYKRWLTSTFPPILSIFKHVQIKQIENSMFFKFDSDFIKLIKCQGRVLLKVVNPNVDVNVDVDVTCVNFAFY